MLVTDGFRHVAQQHPNKLAVVLGRDRCTYGDLLAASQQVANGIWFDFASHVADSQQSQYCRVGLLLTNQIEFLESFLGIAMAGGVAMVLNPDWSSVTLCQLLHLWPPRLLITQKSLLPLLESLSVELKILVIDDVADGELRKSSYQQWRDRQSAEWSAKPIADTTPFYICFTSGTTGQPKAVARHHRSWVNSMAASQVEFGITAEDCVCAPGALVHSLFLYTAIESLTVGAMLYLVPVFNPRKAVAQLQQQAITVLVGVPILLNAIAKVLQSQSLAIPTVRMLISGGAKLDERLHQQIPHLFPAADWFEYYGATELSFISLWSSREGMPLQSVGRAFRDVKLSIRREADGGSASQGDVGWIGVKSDMLSLGYLHQTDMSGYRILEGWATVGDRGWLDEQGYLYLAGREQDMINSGGLKVYPAEVEAALQRLPEIEAAVVFGVPDEDRGDRICAVVQWAESVRLTRRQLQARLRLSLARHKCPHRFFAIEQFPLTTSGKIARTCLRDIVVQRMQHPSIPAGASALQVIL
jgi:long-chain acyl-CoA synthetase